MAVIISDIPKFIILSLKFLGGCRCKKKIWLQERIQSGLQKWMNFKIPIVQSEMWIKNWWLDNFLCQ